jgi:1-acyl-sn-glycerol-3-phosphate acyltransferase
MRHGQVRSVLLTGFLWFCFLGAFVVGYWAVFLGAGILRGRRGLSWALRSYARGFIGLMLRAIPGVHLEVPERSQLKSIRGSVVVCNHLSFLDPLLLLSLLPGTITIVRPDFFRVPVFGWLLLGAGFLGPDLFTGGRPWMDRVRRRLQSGDNLLVFPEGTRSRDGRLGPFKKGAFYLAQQLAAPVVVLRLQGTDRVFPRGRLSLDAKANNTIEVRPLAIISAAEAATVNTADLTAQVRATLLLETADGENIVVPGD